MIENALYFQDVKKIGDLKLPWNILKNRRILLTGATGLIGTFLIDVLMYRNRQYQDGITIYAMSRNKEKAQQRFLAYSRETSLHLLSHDVTVPLEGDVIYDYIIHGASNTHPVAYAQDPIGTITTNILGLANLLEYAVRYRAERVFLMTSVEIYGESRGSQEAFSESDMGYIDCNTLRAGYPESKRVSESLGQAYSKHHDIDIVIGRFSRLYGPTMEDGDSKAVAQFIRNAVSGQDIVLKSAGSQYYSYSYVADAVSALFTILLKGKRGEAYNIADPASDITLKDLAQLLAASVGSSVVFQIPHEDERVGGSTITKAILDAGKLRKLGWKSLFPIESGLEHTIKILRGE